MPTSTKFIPSVAEGLSVNKKYGFTLVELLVVIVIIAILSVIGLTLFTTVQKGARDAKRRGDVNAISKAFEANYLSGSATPYPKPDEKWFVGSQVPNDPQNSGEFVYSWNGSTLASVGVSATYTICAKLENSNGNSADKGNGTTFGPASGNGGFYCAKNVQ